MNISSGRSTDTRKKAWTEELHQPLPNHQDIRHFISIVIPALNEEKYIGDCLRALTELDYPKDRYEIILVDNGSTDRTIEIAKQFEVQLVTKTGGTIGALRNYGANCARGDIIAFVDGDCRVCRDWLKNAVNLFSDPKVGAVGSRLYHNPTTWVARCWSLMHSEKMITGETDWVPSGNMIVARKYFDKVKGFDERFLTSEDYDLCLRLRSKGYKIISDGKISSIHLDPPKTLSEFYRKEIWHGREMVKTFSNTDRKVSRAFMYAIFYLTCLIGILIGTIMGFIFRNYSVLVISVLTFLLTPLFLAIKTTGHSKSYRYLFPLGVLYMAYGIARVACLINLRELKKLKNLREL